MLMKTDGLFRQDVTILEVWIAGQEFFGFDVRWRE